MLAVVAVLTVVVVEVVMATTGRDRSATSFDVGWLWLLLAFVACEAFALRVERRQGELYGFTAAQVPLAAGLIHVHPLALVLVRLLGVGAVLVVGRHRRPSQMAYELGVQLMATLAAIGVVHAGLGGADPVGARGIATLSLALLAAYLVGLVSILLIVRITRRRRTAPAALGMVVRTDLAAGLINAGIGVGLALALGGHAGVELLVVATVAACGASNQLYSRVHEQRQGLQALQGFTKKVVRSVAGVSDIAASVLSGARDLLGADEAVLLIKSVDPDDPGRRYVLGADGEVGVQHTSLAEHEADLRAIVPEQVARRTMVRADAPAWLRERRPGEMLAAPITWANGNVFGVLLVTQVPRITSHFGESHVNMLGELADQASMAIENGLLFEVLEQEAQERAHQALHDPLTDLPNRTRLTEVLESTLERAYAERGRVGLIVIDLDSFNQVVDAFGHRSADGLLIQASSRMRSLLPEAATLGRLGGEQFAVVVPDVSDADDVVAAVRLLIAGFDPPFQSEGVLLALNVNVGVAIYPEQAIDGQSLMQRALIAADTASRLHSGWEMYDPVHDPATPRRLALGADLREALDTDDLDVCFQPKVELATSIVRGAEALVRWNHPRLGRVKPDEFITVAEHTGDIRTLTMVVMRKALAQCRSWRDLGMDLSVAVNLSARNLLDLHLVDDISRALADSGVPPQALTLELTESMVMSESPRSLDVLNGLADLGVRLSCDDFGTGYSSLAHLRRLPINEIKIDKSFIASMTVDDSDRAIARSVLALGRDLGLTTVAEGVESREGWDLLTALGCDLAQGFIVCPPLTPRQFREWLDRRPPHELAMLDEATTATTASTEDATSSADSGDPAAQVDSPAAAGHAASAGGPDAATAGTDADARSGARSGAQTSGQG